MVINGKEAGSLIGKFRTGEQRIFTRKLVAK
jgi:hypothetical protein